MLIAVVMGLVSCITMRSVETLVESQAYGSACEKPTYVTTVSMEAHYSGSSSTGTGFYNSESLRVASMLKEAQSKFGPDVTISNIRWDLQDGKRRSVVFDVIKCK